MPVTGWPASSARRCTSTTPPRCCGGWTDLAAFDVVRYAAEGVLEPGGGRPLAAARGAGRRRQRGRDPPGAGRRLLDAPEGSPPPIVYCADIFDAEALELVVETNIHVNCGSPDMIDQLGRRGPGRTITLRINPGFGHGHSRKTNTGGDAVEARHLARAVGRCLVAAERDGLKVVGAAHAHRLRHRPGAPLPGRGGDGESGRRRSAAACESISAGGGLPVPYRPGEPYVDLDAYFRLWNDTRRRLEDRFGHAVRLEIEPGRYLVAESGYLVAEIRSVKRQGENTFYLVDAGFNNLARPILYGAYHPIAICPADGEHAGARRRAVDVIVGGPLCESGDIFTQDEGGLVVTRRLPQAKVGDLLVIECAGAYGASMASNYNSRPLAAEVLIETASPRSSAAARRSRR